MPGKKPGGNGGPAPPANANVPRDYGLKGFSFESELKNDTLKALLQRPGTFSGPDDTPKDIAHKRLILLFLTAKFYGSFADIPMFGNHIANDLFWANQPLICQLIHRYVKAREAYCSDENRRTKLKKVTSLNRKLCSLVDEFRTTRNKKKWKLTPARKRYISKMQIAWRSILKTDFEELIKGTFVVPGPDEEPDWFGSGGTATNSLAAPSLPVGDSRVGEHAIMAVPAPLFPVSTQPKQLSVSSVASATKAPESQLSEQDEVDRQLFAEMRQWGWRPRQWASHEKQLNEVYPQVKGIEKQQTAQPAPGAVLEVPEQPDLQAQLEEHIATVAPARPLAVPKPAIDKGSAWLELYEEANDAYQALLKSKTVTPQHPFLFETHKMQTLLSSSTGIIVSMSGLLAAPNLAPDFQHTDCHHACDMSRTLAETYRRCIRAMGGTPQDTPRVPTAACCQWHILDELLAQLRGHVSTLTDLLGVTESVLGLHTEYQDALGIVRVFAGYLEDSLVLMRDGYKCH